MSAAKPFLTDAALREKQHAQEQHFVRRARQRFHLVLSPKRYAYLMTKVSQHLRGTKFLGHQPPDKTVWRIRAGGHWIRVVYDHTTDRLVTCLPYGAPSRCK